MLVILGSILLLRSMVLTVVLQKFEAFIGDLWKRFDTFFSPSVPTGDICCEVAWYGNCFLHTLAGVKWCELF